MRKSNKEVLIIDDEVELLLLYEKLIQQAGFVTYTACDGEEGLEKFVRYYPEIVIVDIIMPRKEGIETIMEIKQYDPNVKVVAISGGGEIHALTHLKMAKLLGADYTFKKPLNFDKFLESILDIAETIS